ncbi:MAG TPA: primosomal protein N' [Pirellulaceae bacterium]|nr:primosomal protein N' [Pirellulaceae bacterium]
MTDRQPSLFESEPPEAPWEEDELRDRLVVEVAFAEPPFGPYDYLLPEPLRPHLREGMRVRVPLGPQNHLRIGYCVRVSPAADRAGTTRRLKELRSLVDKAPIVSPGQLDLAKWIAEEYVCSVGEALEGMLPAGVRGLAGTRERTYLRTATDWNVGEGVAKITATQREILEALDRAGRALTPPELVEASGKSLATIRALRKKGLIVGVTERDAPQRRAAKEVARTQPLELNDDQAKALVRILDAAEEGRAETFVLFGATGSGKTEVYMAAIDRIVEQGRQAIVLVPEISLTPQTLERFRGRFDRIAILHSHLTDAERHAEWKQIADGAADVVIGARSAIFAPLDRLGLIVIDEEHDGSFKQDQTPRYHARAVAIRRAKQSGAAVVLGSATPSLETWQACEAGKATRLDMPRRVLDRPLPEVRLLDMRTDDRGRTRRGAISRLLERAMRESLEAGGQTILLLNRRGFATQIQCPACGHVVQCPHCDLSLTHHRDREAAVCHWCEFEMPAPQRCPECRAEGIRYAGVGTERLEAEVRARFPNFACLRMDSDTMKKPGSHEEALSRFRRGEIRVLLGTQMIAKGLDFPNVTLVGVINADTALHFPDFRASERTFQLVTQVAGRTGRGEAEGAVLVQTYSPEHPALQAARRHDYRRFAELELKLRREHGYPPFERLLRIVARATDPTPARVWLDAIAERLRARLAEQEAARPRRSKDETLRPHVRVLGPAEAPLARLRGYSRFHLLIFARDLPPVRKLLAEELIALPAPAETQYVLDVDAYEML